MSHDQHGQEEFKEEYRHIKKDLKSVLITNSILLVLLFALYFVSRSLGLFN